MAHNPFVENGFFFSLFTFFVVITTFFVKIFGNEIHSFYICPTIWLLIVHEDLCFTFLLTNEETYKKRGDYHELVLGQGAALCERASGAVS